VTARDLRVVAEPAGAPGRAADDQLVADRDALAGRQAGHDMEELAGHVLAERDPTESARRRPSRVPMRGIPALRPGFSFAGGAAGVWWPIRPSKPAGPGSPRVGRFDSFAAPL